MNVNQELLGKVLTLLRATLSVGVERQQAETELKMQRAQSGFGVCLLQIMAENKIAENVRQAAAVNFKNYVKEQWQPNVKESILNDGDKNQIKSFIINLMLYCPRSVQLQLSDVVNIISEHDFPEKWPTLIKEIVSKFSTNDFKVVHGVLFTAHSIFKRYRYQYASEELISEMIVVLKEFAEPMRILLQNLVSQIQPNHNNKNVLVPLFKCIVLLLKIFYSLNWQDLPEHFEDNMATYMGCFHHILCYEHPGLVKCDEDDDKPGLLLQAQSTICQCINLYMEKHEEEFGKNAEIFATDVWNLLMKSKTDVCYDKLVARAITYMSTIARGSKHGIFKEETALKQLIDCIVIPSVSLRDVDEELFSDDAQEYIHRDIEGSDSDTRRRSAIELVKALAMHFDEIVTRIIITKVQELLKQYAADPKNSWRAKDVAIYLIIAVSAKVSTSRSGIVEINKHINILDFLNAQILPELEGDPSHAPILKADAIKFVTIFRNQIPKSFFPIISTMVVKFLQHPSKVVHSYASWCIERMLACKDGALKFRYTKEDMKPFAQNIFGALFNALQFKDSEENEYIMKAIMRVSAVLKDDMAPIMGVYIDRLSKILAEKAKNPKNPQFNLYMFESFATVIRYNHQHAAAFETVLFPLFQTILNQNIEEFTPFVFQLLSLLLETRPLPINPLYARIFPSIFNSVLWENTGNIPGLVKYITSFVKKGGDDMKRPDTIQPILTIFQKLVMSNTLDHEGFNVLNSIIENIPSAQLKGLLPSILTVLFNRLQKKRTGKFVRSLIIFFSLFINIHSAQTLVETIEGIQPNLFTMIAPIWYNSMHKVLGKTERKLVAVGVIKLITECPLMIQKFANLWTSFLTQLVEFLEKPLGDKNVVTDILEVEDEGEEDTPAGYKVEYTKLSFAAQSHEDKAPQVTDPRLFLATSLDRLFGSNQALAQSLITAIRALHIRPKLKEYFMLANLKGDMFA